MGLDAVVRCNCYENGLCKPPPVPLEYMTYNDDGFPHLNLPDTDENRKLHKAFWEWEATCCEHEHMEYKAVRISNWGGVSQFKHALESIGWQHFPVLKEYLPVTNDGQIPAHLAQEALKELDYFVNDVKSIKTLVLVDTEYGESSHDIVACFCTFRTPIALDSIEMASSFSMEKQTKKFSAPNGLDNKGWVFPKRWNLSTSIPATL